MKQTVLFVDDEEELPIESVSDQAKFAAIDDDC